jgi:hypothetical protein
MEGFEEIMTKLFSNLVKLLNHRSKKLNYPTPSIRINTHVCPHMHVHVQGVHVCSLGNIIITVLKISDKEKNRKSN